MIQLFCLSILKYLLQLILLAYIFIYIYMKEYLYFVISPFWRAVRFIKV